MIREQDRISGLVLNWSTVDMAKLHVDPVTIKSDLLLMQPVMMQKFAASLSVSWQPVLIPKRATLLEKSQCGLKLPNVS